MASFCEKNSSSATLWKEAILVLIFNTHALAAWRSGHRIRLMNRRPGFESRQGLIILGKT
jgi:hypothetical protein